MKEFNISNIRLTKYLFFTGKGGVSKTSAAYATAVNLADNGQKVLLISTDPASNLQDVFKNELDGKGKEIAGVSNLTVININPLLAAAENSGGVFFNQFLKTKDDSNTILNFFAFL